MARGVNKVILIGNVGTDPDAKALPSGGAVTNITVATSESWKDKNTGQQQDRTEWHRVVMFNRLAEVAAQYLKKGSKVYIEGSLRTRKWQDKSGEDRYTTEIVGSEMQMLDSKPEGQSFQQPPQQNYQQPQQQAQQQNYQQAQQAQQQQAQQQAQPQQRADTSDYDDDIPF